MDNEEQRGIEARPLLQLAAKQVGEALATHLIQPSDPRFHQAVLETAGSLHFALKSLHGVEGLFSNLASSRLDQVEMAIAAINIVQKLANSLSFSDDEVLIGAFWTIAERLLPPQINRILSVMESNQEPPA